MDIPDNVALVNRLSEIGLVYFKSKERLIVSHPMGIKTKM